MIKVLFLLKLGFSFKFGLFKLISELSLNFHLSTMLRMNNHRKSRKLVHNNKIKDKFKNASNIKLAYFSKFIQAFFCPQNTVYFKINCFKVS
jgi:hypothetical protein